MKLQERLIRILLPIFLLPIYVVAWVAFALFFMAVIIITTLKSIWGQL